MTEWQRMTDDEHAAHMTQYVGKSVDILTADEWQKSQQPDYPRFSPRWEWHRVQQIDDGGLGGGVLLDGQFWMRYDEIADMRPTTSYITVPDHTHCNDTRVLQEHFEVVTEMVTDVLWYPARTSYSDETGEKFARSALALLQAMGYDRHDLMQAWDALHR